MTTLPSVLDLHAASQAWGRQFDRVLNVQHRSNMIFELQEQCDTGPARRFLRLCRPGGWSERELAFELDLVCAVAPMTEAAVARPLPGADGRYLRHWHWEGEERYACLFEEAVGRPLRQTTDDVWRFGRGLALLQAALVSRAEVPLGRSIDAAGTCRDACAWLPRHGDAASLLARRIEAVAGCLGEALASVALPEGLCHGDACLQNAALNEDRVTFFDFDECGYGPLALDLATMAAWLRIEPTGAALWAALIAGYEGERVLTAGEVVAMPALILLAELRTVHILARFSGMSEPLWQDFSARVGTRIGAFIAARHGRDWSLP